MRVFVTGGTGLIGAHFIAASLGKGHEVIALKRPGSQPRIELDQQPRWVDGDLADVSEDMLQGCNVLVHLASHGVDNPSGATWEKCFQVNVVDSLNLWLTADRAEVGRYVIAGSCFEYGKSGETYDFVPTTAPLLPTGPYHSSKAAATAAALGFCYDKNREVMILRPFHVYGEGEAASRFWPSLRRAALAGEDFPMTDGTQVRDFCHVSEIAAQFLEYAERGDVASGNPLVANLGSGSPVTLAEFATSLWTQLGATGRLLKGAVPMRKNEVMRFVPDISGK